MGKIQYIKGYEMNKFHKQILEIYHSLNLPEHFNNTGNKHTLTSLRFRSVYFNYKILYKFSKICYYTSLCKK